MDGWIAADRSGKRGVRRGGCSVQINHAPDEFTWSRSVVAGGDNRCPRYFLAEKFEHLRSHGVSSWFNDREPGPSDGNDGKRKKSTSGWNQDESGEGKRTKYEEGEGEKVAEERKIGILLTRPATGRSNSRRFAHCTAAALFLTAYTYMWRFQNKTVSRRNFLRTSRHDTIEQTLVNR